MIWEDLTSVEFKDACVKTKGVCVLPLGVIEKHGTHLPLGTDMFHGRRIAEEVAKVEPVMIFPSYYFGQIAEARHCPGTIAINPELMYSMLEEVCNEISRNGFRKIVILDAHGGNVHFLNYFIQSTLYKKREYAVYNIRLSPDEQGYEEVDKVLEGRDSGSHGGNFETSRIMVIRPDLVKMDQVEQEGLKNYGMLNHLNDVYTAVNWYANHPTHFAGEPYHATPELGQLGIKLVTKKVVACIKAIKEDNVVAELLSEFYSKTHE